MIHYAATQERIQFVVDSLRQGAEISEIRFLFAAHFGLGLNAFGHYLKVAQMIVEYGGVHNNFLLDESGRIVGGSSYSNGMTICWSNDDENDGATVEQVIQAALDRVCYLEIYGEARACRVSTATHLRHALAAIREGQMECNNPSAGSGVTVVNTSGRSD